MKRWLILAAALLAGHVFAQSRGEISFWESVRDSKNPAELRAYLQQYPNGTFKAIAEARLAGLEKAPTARAAEPPPPLKPLTAETRMPVAGDTWTYSLTYPRIRGQWGQTPRPPSVHVVTVSAITDGKIFDQLSVDGGSRSEIRHSPEAYFGPEGVSLFSPYLVAYRDLRPRMSVGRVTILDPECGGTRQVCDASGRVIGPETVQTRAGTFNAVKVVVEETWRSSGNTAGGGSVAGLMGGRIVTAWYVPELKRVAKVQSRLTVGDLPPVDSNFDLELTSYRVK